MKVGESFLESIRLLKMRPLFLLSALPPPPPIQSTIAIECADPGRRQPTQPFVEGAPAPNVTATFRNAGSCDA